MKTIEDVIFRLLDDRASVCRFCFHELDNNLEEKYAVYGTNLAHILQFCCINPLLKEDTILPKFICVTCHASLQSAYNFLSKVNTSQNTLEKYLEKKFAIESAVDYNEQEESTQSLTTGNCEKEESNNECFVDCKSLEQSKISKNAQLLTCCNEKFSTKTLYNKHIRSHSIVKRNFSCLNCDKKYISNYELEIHSRTHTGERPFTCSVCQKTFIDNRNLKKHEKIHSGKKEHECLLCHRKFLHLFSLKIHERIHRNEKQYICETCGKSFNTSGELRTHRRVHTKERPYICSLCEKRFASKPALNIHTKVHTGDKKFSCGICERQCRTPFDLKVHVRCHSNEKPYLCKYANCQKRYKNSSQLNVHLRTHTGEKRHQCTICLKQFGEANTLRRHRISHEKKTEKNSTLHENSNSRISREEKIEKNSTLHENSNSEANLGFVLV